MKLRRSKKEITKLNMAVLVIVLVVIIFCVVVYFTVRNSNFREDDIIYLKNLTSYIESVDDLQEESYLLTSYDEYREKIKTNELSKRNFKNNNYLFLRVNYNMCDTSDDFPIDYSIQNNEVKIIIDDYESCNICAFGNKYYLIRLDKKITNPNVTIEHKIANPKNCDGVYLN